MFEERRLEEHERCTRVAVELLQTQNPRAILMLKNFLTYIPSPTNIKNILTAAIAELIETFPDTVCWLLEHPEYLQPEVDVTQVVMQELLNRLENLGFVQGQDFHVSADYLFEVSEAAKLALLTQSQILDIQNPLPILDRLQSSA